MQESIVFLVRLQCRRNGSSRSLSHLLMSFLCYNARVTRLIEGTDRGTDGRTDSFLMTRPPAFNAARQKVLYLGFRILK